MIDRLATHLRNIETGYWTIRARLQFMLRGAPWPRNLTVKGPFGLSYQGFMDIDEGLTIVSSSRFNRAGINHPTQIVVGAGAKLSIGANCGLSGVSLYCMDHVEIGRNVEIGANCKIWDYDFHPVLATERAKKMPACTGPIIIEDDVWLGADVMVLKGVHIGARSVAAARSVITHDVPADCVVAGIPAKIVRSLIEKKNF